jgi:hypothetical protein
MVAYFYPGSPVRAQDLNNNFTQILLALQDVEGRLYQFIENYQGFVRITGDTMEGPLDMDDFQLTGVPDPVDGTDAANKYYVDEKFGGNTEATAYAYVYYTATQGDTVLESGVNGVPVFAISIGLVQVYINGALQQKDVDYIVNSTTKITVTQPLLEGDVVGIYCINNIPIATAGQATDVNYTYPGGESQTLQKRLESTVYVDDFIPAGTDTAAVNCSQYIQNAFDAIKSQGGGTVNFNGQRIYLMYASQSTQWGDTGAYVGSSTIVNGNMCKIIFNARVAPGGSMGGGPTAFRSISTTTNQSILTGAYAVGDLVYNVADASDFYEGEEVQVRIIDNAYDDAEAIYYYSAEITDITGNAITLSRGVPEAFNADSQSTDNNRRIIGQGADGLPKDVVFKNIKFQRYEGSDARPTEEDDRVIELRNSKNQGIENVALYRSSVLIRAVEQGYIRNIRANYNRISGSGSKGFPISVCNCYDYVIDGVYVENFQRAAIQNESYCKGIIKNVTAVNNIFQTYGVKSNVNSSNNTGILQLTQESAIKVENLKVVGAPGSYSSSTASAEAKLNIENTAVGGTVESYRHVEIATTASIAANYRLGVSSGMFTDTSRPLSTNLDMIKEHTSIIAFNGTETGTMNFFEAVPENCLILGWSFHIENEADMTKFSSVALRYRDNGGTLVTPSQYSLSPTTELVRYKISSFNLQYGPTSTLSKMNYYYDTERRVFIVLSGSPSAGARLVVTTQYAAISGAVVSNLNTSPTS